MWRTSDLTHTGSQYLIQGADALMRISLSVHYMTHYKLCTRSLSDNQRDLRWHLEIGKKLSLLFMDFGGQEFCLIITA